MEQQTVQKTDIEQIEEQTATPEVTVESKPAIGGGSELQSALGEVADSMDVSGFKCAHEECGLVHSHDTNKHRASDDFDMSQEEAADMEMNSVCHCGLNELAHEGVAGAPDPSRANSMAPIPDTATRHIKDS